MSGVALSYQAEQYLERPTLQKYLTANFPA